MNQSLQEATEAIYASIENDNEDLDQHIETLKSVMQDNGLKEAVFEPQRLVQNNRAGRKMMQSYFKKRGVKVSFAS